MSSELKDRLKRFEVLLRKIIKDLKQNHELGFHKAVDMFYYMQKAEEIRLLAEQLDEASERLEEIQKRACFHYTSIFQRWQRDARSLNSLNRGKERG